MAASLSKVPRIFIHILHLGYLFDEATFFSVFKRLSTESENHSNALAVLRSAGFGCTIILDFLGTNEGDVNCAFRLEPISNQILGSVRSLKQLSRSAVRHCLWKSKLKTPIPKAALPLPITLISFLCYTDIEL